MDPSSPAPPALKKNDYSKIDSYSCNKCTSTIKIISIDEDEAKITFECLNQEENHQKQTLSINEYLESMGNNIYINGKCSICQCSQNLTKNLPIFEYCTTCKKVICDKCKGKHIEKSNKIDHFFINNNEKYIKCLIHLQNNKNIVFCKDCNMHLCKECLKSRKHLNHKKNALYELQLSEENKLNHSKIINLLKEEMKQLNEEKNNKTKVLKHKMNISKNKIKEEYQKKININKQNLENELKKKEEKLEKDLYDLEQKYLNDVQRIKKKFEEEKNDIICQFNKKEINIKSLFNEKLFEDKQFYNNNEDFLFLQKLCKQIKNKNDLIIINEILKNTQEKNENNYYFNENINNAIESFKNSKNDEIRKISNNNIQIQKNDFLTSEEDNNNINKDNFNKKNNSTNKAINNNNNNNTNTYNNFYNNHKKNNVYNDHDNINCYYNNRNNNNNHYNHYNNYYNSHNNNLNIHNDINYNSKDNMNNNIIFNKNNNLNDNIFLSKKTRSTSIEKNNSNKMKKIDNNSYKNIPNDNSSKDNEYINTEEIDHNNPKRDFGTKGLNFKTYCIINDSYCPILIDSSFVVFESIKTIAYLIYSTKNKFIVAYNLTYREIESKIPSNHSEYISNFKYCFNSFINKEIIMSISFKDSHLRIWRFEDWQCIIDIKNVYSSGYLYSACFLNKQNHYYFVTSNWKESKFPELIRVYDYDKNIVKTIKNSNYNSFSIKTLYNKENIYILVCNEDNIKSYDYNKNDLHKLYEDCYSFCKLLSFQIYKNNQKYKILGSCHDKIIRVWDFYTGNLMNKIEYELNELRGIITYNESLLIGVEDNLIQFIDLKNHKKIKTLYKHEDKICSIQKKFLKNYGSCLFSQSFDNKIILWNAQN